MNRKTKQPKAKPGDTRYIHDNYPESVQLRNEFVYKATQWLKIDAEMREIMLRLMEFKPKVSIEPA